MWFSNVPHTRLVEDKGGQNWIAIKKDKFVFPGGGTQFIHGADQYLNQISQVSRIDILIEVFESALYMILITVSWIE